MKYWLFLLLLSFLPACGAAKKECASAPIGSSVSLAGGTVVVIDSGHGGNDEGAKGHKPYCEEKRLTLQTARLVKKYLTQLGYHVIMTRSADTYVSLDKRVEIANKAGAEIFVSIHFNSSRNPTAKGIEVFFCEGSSHVRNTSSRKLASSVLTHLIRRTQSVSRGIKKGNFYVIRETNMPAILVEGGFISNPEERARLKDPEHVDKIARAVANGVDQYFKKK